MDVWKEKALRESLRPKTGWELVQQSRTMDIAIAVAVVGLRQGGTDRVKVVVLERKGLEVLENCRPNTGDVLELKVGDLQRAAYPVVTEAGELTLSYTVVVARRSKPRGSMAGV